jgi:hypothetical protein
MIISIRCPCGYITTQEAKPKFVSFDNSEDEFQFDFKCEECKVDRTMHIEIETKKYFT